MMKIGRLVALTASAFALAAVLAGCGGGGTGGSAVTGGRAPVDVFVTDAFSDQYRQVLTTLFKIELSTDGATFLTVFDDPSGRTLDLSSMANSSELLASLSIPAGTYTKARITFGDHVTLISNLGVTSIVAVDTSVGTDVNGQIAITVSTPARVFEHQGNSITIDFKLAEFQLVGSILRPKINCDNGNDHHPGGTHTAHVRGIVSALNGATSFTMTDRDGDRTTTVNLTSSTTITSGQTGAAATLATGQAVTVQGTFDPASATITARTVTIDDFTTNNHAEARGSVKSISTAAGKFEITVLSAEDFQPTGGTIVIATNANTRFHTGRDHQGTLADVRVGSVVEVQGSFDTTSQTLTARGVEVHTD